MKLQIFTVVRRSKKSQEISGRLGSFTSLEVAKTFQASLMGDNISYHEIVRSDVYSSIEEFRDEADAEIARKILASLSDEQRSALERYFSKN